MTWILLEGIALPSPVVTSSSTAKWAQSTAAIRQAQTTQMVTRDIQGESSSITPSTSGMNAVSCLRLPRLAK
ncbi:hypothetical protein D9M69_716520 [compost metagenome]